MATVKYVLKGHLFKKVKDENSNNKLCLPEGYSVQVAKNGFYIKKRGNIITNKLIAVYKKDTLAENILELENDDGTFSQIDTQLGLVSQKYARVLSEKPNETVAVAIDNDIIKIEGLRFRRTGYSFINELHNDLPGLFAVVKKAGQYGIIHNGDIVCPTEFYTPNISIKKSNEFYLVKSSDKQLLVSRAGKILLTGSEVYNIIDKGAYLLIEDSKSGQIPYYASYDKSSDETMLYGYAWGREQGFVELAYGETKNTFPGRVYELHNLFGEYFLATETTKNGKELISLSGDMRIVGEEPQENSNNIVYKRRPSQIGKMVSLDGLTKEPALIKTNIPYAQLVVFRKDNDYGVLDLNTRRIVVPAKFLRIYAVVQNEYGEYRSVVENQNENCGVVDESGNSLIHLKHRIEGIKTINFGKDGATHLVIKLAYVTTNGSDYVYVDPENVDCLASEVAIKRYREAAGESKKISKQEEME